MLLLIADDYQYSKVGKKNIQYGVVVHLPFRFCLGQQMRFTEWLDEGIDVYIRNTYDIPEGTDCEEQFSDIARIDQRTRLISQEHIWSDLLVVCSGEQVTDQIVHAVNEWMGPEKKSDSIGLCGLTQTMRVLRELVFAYGVVQRAHWKAGIPRPFGTPIDVINRPHAMFLCVTHANRELTPDDINYFFSLDMGFQWGGRDGIDYSDLPSTASAAISPLIRLQREFVFYEFEGQAQLMSCDGNYLSSLVMSVAALEGAHAALLHYELENRMSGNKEGRARVITELMREHGFYALYQITPYLFMEEDERPDDETILKSIEGIRMRNAIMHSLRDTKGVYRIRRYTEDKVGDAISAVRLAYLCYAAAVERRVTTELGITTETPISCLRDRLVKRQSDV